MLGREQKKKKKKGVTGEGEGKERNACPQTSLSLCRVSRVEGSMSRVEGNNFCFFFFFKKMKNKWKTNKKNLKDKWRVDISNQISSNFWVVGAGRGRKQNTLLHNLRTSSALLTSHVKNVVKKFLKKLI